MANVSLHHFSDASELGYGQCSYIRMVNETGRIHCSLLLEKSRVVHKKFMSIARLELQALNVFFTYFYKNFICWTRAKMIILVRWRMLVFIIFLMLQSLAMDSVAISWWSMKQAEFIAACYWKNQELSIRSLHQLQGWS